MRKFSAYTAVIAALVILSNFVGGQTLTWDETNAVSIENNNGNANDPQIAISGESVVAVWAQSDGAYSRIYSNYSIDGGATWSDTRLIDSPTGHDAVAPQIAISMETDYDTIVAVWCQDDGSYYNIYSNYSTDGGANWHSAQPIETYNGNGVSAPHVAISGNNVVAIWAQYVGMSPLIYSNHATITGEIVNWGTYQQISPDEWTGYEPQIAISRDNVAAIWRGSSGGSDSIYSNYSANGGEKWTGVQAVDNNGNPAYGGPQIVISGNTTVTIWRQYDGSSQHIYSNYAIIDNGVITWVPEQTIMVSNNYYAVNDPKIATSGNTVVAIWQQVESSSSNNQIYSKYATISSEGIPTWNSEDQLVGYDAEQLSEKPQIAISGDNVAAVWVKNDGVLYDRIYSNYTTINDAGAVLWDTTNVDTVSNSDAGGDNPQIAISGDNVVAVWEQLAAGNNPPSSVYSNYARVAADSNSGDGGSLPIGPLAAGLSGFLTWWKRRKQKHS